MWNSLIGFKKLIDFESSSEDFDSADEFANEGEGWYVEIFGGVFDSLFAGEIGTPGSTMEVARGYYIRLTAPGTHTP